MKLNSYEIRSDGWALFRIPACLLVFTHGELRKAIRRGKIWRRHGEKKLTARKEKRLKR